MLSKAAAISGKRHFVCDREFRAEQPFEAGNVRFRYAAAPKGMERKLGVGMRHGHTVSFQPKHVKNVRPQIGVEKTVTLDSFGVRPQGFCHV